MFQIISDIISVLELCLYYMYYSRAVSVLVYLVEHKCMYFCL